MKKDEKESIVDKYKDYDNRSFSFSIHLTSSKILAYIILIMGFTYAMITRDAVVLTTAMGAAAGVMAVKTYTQ